ncbi:arginyl tRNA protein transferase 1 [Echinococcus multilocularis]|uniref:Arginyl-tRNA--protein transferase 1 n=1 Tax=Echinococcus multilocularis TaxID=6211 RepID=A0A068YAV0_ECHMU|nr:arginyl tRNA protein transferase 1 [Echinococcus multilocularis]
MEPHPNPTYSLIELEGVQTSDSCRYCDDTTSPKANWCKSSSLVSLSSRTDLSSRGLLVDDYKILMDRGWRRHGSKVSKPMNKETCCPAYPIRCDTQQFRISKAQKKAIRLVANFLRAGEKPDYAETSRDVHKACGSSRKSVEGTKTKDSGKIECEAAPLTPGRGVSAKQRRWKARQERMAQRAGRTGESLAELMEAHVQSRKLRIEKYKPKELEEYLKEVEWRENDVHRLEIRSYRSAPLSSDLSKTLDEEYKLYHNYQVSVHKASPDSITREAFEKSIVESTLVNAHNAAAEAAGAPQFGSYHQQYWLDESKLIAVGVVDLLPGYLSSVYFFFDPQYTCLNLGTYSALREIAFVRHLHRTYGAMVPAYADFTYYSLGHYVHSCTKMNYKAEYSPSWLACPETYAWVHVEECQRLLDQSKYSRFAEEGEKDSVNTPCDEEVKVHLLFSEALTSALPDGRFAVEGDAVVTTLADARGVLCERDLNRIREWVDLVKDTGTMLISCTNWNRGI